MCDRTRVHTRRSRARARARERRHPQRLLGGVYCLRPHTRPRAYADLKSPIAY